LRGRQGVKLKKTGDPLGRPFGKKEVIMKNPGLGSIIIIGFIKENFRKKTGDLLGRPRTIN